jgi:DNA invertase Pin-like site-specific DNA recombinase
MKVALYSRVSTADQNAAMQLDELRAYCLRRQWDIVEEYTDEGVSGSKESRPALDRLMKAAKRRSFGAVLVYRYDRFSRSLSHLVSSLGVFDAMGIAFVSLHEGTDTSTPNGKLIFSIFASIAEFERSLAISRTKSGIEAARKRGAIIGRPRVVVDADRVRALRASGLSWEKVAAETGVARATCQRAVAAWVQLPRTLDCVVTTAWAR